jgi:hypothetical protein
MAQDHKRRVSKKDSDIPVFNFVINVELFQQTSANVEFFHSAQRQCRQGANPQGYNLIHYQCATFSYFLRKEALN